jgi:hypothetical protein
MKRITAIGIVCLAAMVLTSGCKKVQTTFVNTTDEPVELQVTGPGYGTGFVGTVPPRGQIRTEIEVYPDWLPYTYTFTADEQIGAFTLTKDVNSKIWIDVPQLSGSSDPKWRHAEGHRQIGGLTAGPIVYEP